MNEFRDQEILDAAAHLLVPKAAEEGNFELLKKLLDSPSYANRIRQEYRDPELNLELGEDNKGNPCFIRPLPPNLDSARRAIHNMMMHKGQVERFPYDEVDSVLLNLFKIDGVCETIEAEELFDYKRAITIREPQ